MTPDVVYSMGHSPLLVCYVLYGTTLIYFFGILAYSYSNWTSHSYSAFGSTPSNHFVVHQGSRRVISLLLLEVVCKIHTEGRHEPRRSCILWIVRFLLSICS